jgi:MFS family permease
MFNYIDRYVLAAVEKSIASEFFGVETDDTKAKMGLLATAFVVSYLVAAPIFGWLADRTSRWLLVGAAVILWSLASSASGMASGFTMLLITRMFVGIGEAGYGPAAPTIIADYYPVERRGRVLAWFYMAIPVGSALGYGLGGLLSHFFGWRWAFFAVAPPGILLGLWALWMRDPPRGQADGCAPARRRASWRDYATLLKTPSYVLDTLGMTALTFAIGGISFWMPRYLQDCGGGDEAEVNIKFGAICVVTGIIATLLGGWIGDWLRARGVRGAYFLVSGMGIFLSCPMIILVPFVPFPWAWGVIFLGVFFLFFNTGPVNTILANVTHPSMRSTAFAVNIFLIHALGDAISPPILGMIVGKGHERWNAAFLTVAAITALAGVLWILGARYLDRDTELAKHRLSDAPGPDAASGLSH